jgi:hypothetical protein
VAEWVIDTVRTTIVPLGARPELRVYNDQRRFAGIDTDFAGFDMGLAYRQDTWEWLLYNSSMTQL